jgi:hypothetical protein
MAFPDEFEDGFAENISFLVFQLSRTSTGLSLLLYGGE